MSKINWINLHSQLQSYIIHFNLYTQSFLPISYSYVCERKAPDQMKPMQEIIRWKVWKRQFVGQLVTGLFDRFSPSIERIVDELLLHIQRIHTRKSRNLIKNWEE